MAIKGIPVAPLTGLLDVRSTPDLMAGNSLRWRQNLQTAAEGKLRRGCGWTKALDQATYNNQDFHDQLLTFGGSVREPITCLAESESSRGIRTLWAATQSRIARLNETTGNWKIIGSGFGGGAGTDTSGPRFKCAVAGDFMWWTNNYDRPQLHRLEQPPFDSALLVESDDLETIGLTKAALVWEWKGVIFFADVEMDSERHANRVVWGDYRNPQSFDPTKPETIAGYKDLNYGERILAGGPTVAGTFMIYTTKGIWELSAVGGTQVFAWKEAYPGADNDFVGVMKYENTLIDIGGEHLYLAKDRPYLFSPYRSAPEPVEWLHRAAGVLYDDIDTTACAAHIGFCHDDEAFISVKRTTDDLPGITLRINTQYKVCDVIDHGFTAAVNFRSQPIQSIRDFIADKRICTLAGLDALGYGFENEGLPSPAADPTAEFEPQSFYTSTSQTIGDVETEDWDAATADADSLCALLGDVSLDSICRNCEGVSKLILASSADWCLKEYGGFYRERCVNTSAVGSTDALGYTSSVGSYVNDGYTSLVRFAPLFVENGMVTIERFKLNAIPVAQTPPSRIGLRIGVSGQVADSNDDNCLIVWDTCESRLLECQTKLTSALHKAGKTVPSQPIEWGLYITGRVIHVEMSIGGIGGDCELSGVLANAKREETRNF